MELDALLDEARAASPQERIQWRDRIASHGQRAIDGIKPWLADDTLAAFAIRVIWRAGETGVPDQASSTLRAVRSKLSPALQGDVDWALLALKRAGQAEAAKTDATKPVPAPAGAVRRAPVARERPLNSPAARRRTS